MSNSLPLFHFLLPPSESNFQDKQQTASFTRFYINDEKINRLDRISFEKENLKQTTHSNEINDNNSYDNELLFEFDEKELNN